MSSGSSPHAEPCDIVLSDQFGARRSTRQLEGSPALLVHGDRRSGTEARRVGAALHEALCGSVPVIPVIVLPSVQAALHGMVRSTVRAASPQVPVWLDFTGTTRDRFGIIAGRSAVVVLDARGRLHAVRHAPFATAALAEIVALIRPLVAAGAASRPGIVSVDPRSGIREMP